MIKQISNVRDRLSKRRAERRASRVERTLRQNEAKTQRLRHKRFDDQGGGPLAGGGI